MTKRTMYLADASLLLVALIWGSGFVATKTTLVEVTPYYLMAFRFAIGTLLLGVFFWKRIAAAKKQDIIAGSVIGIFMFSAFAAQTIGLLYTTASKQAFLTGTNVVIVPFLAWALYRKKPDVYSFAATFVALGGIALLTLQGTLALGLGDGLTLLCAVLFAGHIVAIGHFAKDQDPIVLAAIQMGFTTVFSFIFAAFFGEPWPVPNMTSSGWSGILYMGIASSFVAFTVQNVAQRYTTSTHAALILCLESVFGTLLSVWLLGEEMTVKMIMGCVLIMVAIVTAETRWNFLKKRKPSNAA